MSNKQMIRSYSDRMIAGVAAGLADYFGMDVTLMRLLWAIMFFSTGGTAILLYFILWVVLPRSDFEGEVNGFDPEEIIIEDVA